LNRVESSTLLATLAEVEDSGRPPVISDVQVLNVKRGIFLSVTIGWQTDTLTDALVRYGDNDLLQTSDPSKRLGLQHQVVLSNLKPNRAYNFSAVAQDLFGRSQVSETLTFSTSKPLTTTQTSIAIKLSGSGNTIGIDSSFKRLGNDYLVELTLDHTASVFIGSLGVPRKQGSSDESTSGLGADTEAHVGLSSEAVISMDACHGCHQNQNTATHPVNVYPKPGMTIPLEYPTLPDGRITCNSCHSLHSSDYEMLSRKQRNRELCIGCHVDMM